MADNYNRYTMQQRRDQQQPHFLRRDRHGMGDGAGGEDDAAMNNGIENLVLPRPLPEGMKRNYIRKRRNDGIIRTQQQRGQDGNGGGGVGRHQQYNMPQPDAFGPPHLLGDGGKYYAQQQQQQQHRIDLADADSNYDHSHALPDTDDSPWQISLVFLFGVVAVLVFLILNLVIDPAVRLPNHQRSGGRSRHKRRVSSFTTKKKKTDAWSEDEVDQGDLADNEKGGGVRAGGAHHAYNTVDGGDDSASSGVVMQEGIAGRSACLDNQDSASSSLYYNAPPGYFPQGPQQQHRQRKPQAAAVATQAAASTTASETATVVAPMSPAPNRVLPDSRRQYKRSPSSKSQQKSPIMSHPKAVVSPSAPKRTFDLQTNPPPAQAGAGGAHDAAYLGAGLVGFQSPQRKPKPQAPPPPSFGEKGGVVLATPKRVSERQVSIDLESGHPSEAEDGDEIGGETGATTGDGADYGVAGQKLLGSSSPFHSFGSIPSPDYTEKKEVAAKTPTVGSSNAPPPPPLLDISKTRGPTVDRSESFESPQGLRHRRISSLTTPKLVVQLGHEDMEAATPLVDNKRRIRLDKEPSTSFDSQDSPHPSSRRVQAVPFMPNINESPSEFSPSIASVPVASGGGDDLVPTPSTSQGATPFIPQFAQSPENSEGSSSRASHVSAPRSVPIEDLHLIRMESGHGDSFGGKWAADGFDFAKAPAASEGPVLPQPKVYQHSYRRQETPLHANYGPGQTHGQIAAKTVLQQSLHPVDEVEASGGGEGGNQIKHKRDDLTTWSDSAASLTSPIDFKEIKLLSVIGGGGFGQVWKASWRGTPIAVKLLSMSAQTDNVPKKVLQEFVSEINMLSGMRHPNICLYMGACLVPPNRAIVTELAAHGSVWDALRQPLDSPYVAADGLTRTAWPLSLYGITDTPAPVQVVPGQQWYDASAPKQDVAPHIPFPPSGTWPWALVKRVASGGVRGMIYLHGGSPPVLHRDLKSANLLLDDSYTAKIADFGLSRIKATERSMTGNCGTVQWMPPECLASSDYAEPADVYSFGIIMWELLTRECPFDGKTPIQCALAVLNNDARPPIPDWCPPALMSLIKSCVTRKPSERPTFEEVLEALDGMM
mmetsp:Transcript_1733/g.3389  ORF Transcript_1733/g.3389 Transcript_1733/m.3389 type:complete len:1106 (+) Transcript_1733:277-3594(+)